LSCDAISRARLPPRSNAKGFEAGEPEIEEMKNVQYRLSDIKPSIDRKSAWETRGGWWLIRATVLEPSFEAGPGM
jgi:hypothetical protein